MCGSEQKFINRAFESNWIAPVGPNLNDFEDLVSSYVGVKYAAALSSGTAAIHLALITLGIGHDDEVITSTLTFIGTANPILYQGAIPVFVDSEEDTWNICPELLEKTIKDRIKKGKLPKAILSVHLYGMPSDMDKIMNIARHYDIPIIEDAAEALGSRFNDKSVGSFGEAGVFSFNGNKIITTSGGGILVSDNQNLVEKVKFFSTQARDPAPHYQHSTTGYNYRMSNILAGIGCGQMEVLNERIEQRRDNFNFYRERLEDLPGISFSIEPNKKYYSNRWLTTILIDPRKAGITREDVRLHLEKENIESRPLWKPMHLQPVFSGCPFYQNGTSEELFRNGLCLPSGSNLTEDDRERIITNLRKCFKG